MRRALDRRWTVSHPSIHTYIPAGSRERRRGDAGGEASCARGAPVSLPRRLPGGLLLRGEAARLHHDQAGNHQATPRQQLTDYIHPGLHLQFCISINNPSIDEVLNHH